MIKTEFTSTELALITGIKPATLRMWERRHNVVHPEKKNRNIRYYSLEEVKKILNLAFLNKAGYKISKIASMPVEVLNQMAQEQYTSNNIHDAAIKDLKLAMYQFDNRYFEKVYIKITKQFTFTDVFLNTLIPFLSFIGHLWQTSALSPLHEHFISNLIAEKLLLETAKLSPQKEQTNKVYVLFLWENEIHELGLMFANYLLKSRGHHTIYLGRNIPIQELNKILEIHSNITFVNHFTLQAPLSKYASYLDFCSKHQDKIDSLIWVGNVSDEVLKANKIIKHFNNSKAFYDSNII